jgi:hypothetical protein
MSAGGLGFIEWLGDVVAFWASIMFKRTGTVDWKKCNFAVTIIQIKPFRNGWQVDKAPRVIAPVQMSVATPRIFFSTLRFIS